jgi:hypothetical protein
VAALGLAAGIAGLFLDARATLAGWLTASLFLVGLSLGAMTVLMIHGLTGGRWGDAVRPQLRAMVAILPVGLVLLLPVLVRLDLPYAWAGADAADLPDSIRAKAAYLNPAFFVIRFAACSIVWPMLAWLLLGWTSVATDPDDRSRHGTGFALGLIVQGIAVSIFSIDWMLSLDPDFASTIYAVLEASAEALGAFALAVLLAAAARPLEREPGGKEEVALGEDVANMMFGFMLVWAYLSYMQWLVVWAGNLPEDIDWYLVRAGGWRYLLGLLICLGFALPFAGLLVRSLKRSHSGLIALAGLVLAGHLLDVAWRIRPALADRGAPFSWPDLAAAAGAGGLWAAALLFVRARPDLVAPSSRRLLDA